MIKFYKSIKLSLDSYNFKKSNYLCTLEFYYFLIQDTHSIISKYGILYILIFQNGSDHILIIVKCII